MKNFFYRYRYLIFSTLAIITVSFGYSNCNKKFAAIQNPDAQVKINGREELKTPALGTGYLHGFDWGVESRVRPIELVEQVKALRPKYWRLGLSSFGANYGIAKMVNPDVKLTMVLLNMVEFSNATKYDSALSKEENLINNIKYNILGARKETYYSDVKTTGFTYASGVVPTMQVDYWDLINEPDNLFYNEDDSQFFDGSGNCDYLIHQFEVMTETVRDLIRNQYIKYYNPRATGPKIVAPSVADFHAPGGCNPSGQGPSLMDLYVDHFFSPGTNPRLRPEALSWHEFGSPEEMRENVSSVREKLRHYGIKDQDMPEIHINEFKAPRDRLNPGLEVRWFDAFERSRVAAFNRSCWEFDGVSECSFGLNGLFEEKILTGGVAPLAPRPRALYWINRFYAELPEKRLQIESQQPGVAIMAGYQTGIPGGAEENRVELKVLIGRSENPESTVFGPQSLVLHIENLPFQANKDVMVRVVRYQNYNQSIIVYSPEYLPAYAVRTNANASFDITVPNIMDGEAAHLIIEQN